MATKNKITSIKKAKKEFRTTIWLDANDKWHASTNLMNTPFYAKKVEDLNGNDLSLELAKLAIRYK